MFAAIMNSGIIYKRMTALILTVIFFIQMFNRSFIVVNYYTHAKTYAAVCENQDKPQVHCNGRCQLMKKLKQEDNKDQQNPNRKADHRDEVLFAQLFSLSLQNVVLSSEISYPHLLITFPADRNSGIFHPPQG